MFSLWNLVVSAVALCSTVRHTVTTASLAGIVERGHRRVGTGRVALVASLHASSLTLSSSSRSLNGVRHSGRHLYDAGLTDGSDSNVTRYLACLKSGPLVLTALPYSGTKALSVYNIRRELAVFDANPPRALAVYDRGPQELVVYYRPSALVVYAPPMDYTFVGPDPLSYQLAIRVYSRLHQFDARLFQVDAHWDHQAFEHLITIIASEWPNPRERLMIGEYGRRSEGQAAHWFSMGFGLGIVLVVTSMAIWKLRGLEYFQPRPAPVLGSEFEMEAPKFASKKLVDVPRMEAMTERVDEEALRRSQACEPISAPTAVLDSEFPTEMAGLATSIVDELEPPSAASSASEIFRMRKCSFGRIDVRSASNNDLSRVSRAPRPRERCSSSSGRLHWSFQVANGSCYVPPAPEMAISDPPPAQAISPTIFSTLEGSSRDVRREHLVQIVSSPQRLR